MSNSAETTTPTSPPASAHAHAQLARAVRATGGMTLLSRLGGLVRDVVLGRLFGDTWIGSAFAFAFALPNMFRRLFGEGALSAAFIPAYTDAHRDDLAPSTKPASGLQAESGARAADQLASFTLATLGLVTCGLTVLAELAIVCVLLFAPHDPERALSLKLVMVMLPFMPLICAVAILAGMLQVHGRYAAAASGPVILNAFVIGVGAYFLLTGQLGGERTAYVLGAATVLSGATQALWFARLLRPHVRWSLDWRGARARAVEMLRRFLPVAVGLGTLQISTMLDNLIAMWPILVGPSVLGHDYPLDSRSNVILSLTSRLYQFPLGVFGIAVATAIFPLLARHASDADHARFADTLRRGLRLSLFIGLPATVGLLLVRHDAVGVMYGHGKTGWSADSLSRSAAVLSGFAAGVWAYSLNHVLTRAFYARKDTVTPMRVSIAMMIANLALNLVLMWPFREAGLAWATSACAALQCLVLGLLLRRRTGAGEPVLEREALVAAARIVLAALIMSAAVLGCERMLPAGSGWSAQLVRLAAMSGVGGAAFLGAAVLLRCPELRWLLRRH